MKKDIKKWQETQRRGMLKFQDNQRKNNLAKLKAGTLYPKYVNSNAKDLSLSSMGKLFRNAEKYGSVFKTKTTTKVGIPQRLKEEMKADPYYQKCCLTGIKKKDGFKLDWHHAWEYSGRQIQEKWAIMPIWWRKHAAVNGDSDSVHNCKETELKVKYLSLCRVNLENLKMRMPKKNWDQEFKVLKNKFNLI